MPASKRLPPNLQNKGLVESLLPFDKKLSGSTGSEDIQKSNPIWRHPSFCHLAKIKCPFLEKKGGGLYNSNKYLMLGRCYSIHARQKFLL